MTELSLWLSHSLPSFLQDSCVRYLPRLYLDIHVRGCCLVGWVRGVSGVSGVDVNYLCCWLGGTARVGEMPRAMLEDS